MKNVKFRGKCLNTGKWVYGDLIQTPMDDGVIQYKIWDHSEGVGLFRVMQESVGMFIGGYDKNGKEMYTGDIILFLRPAIYPEERSHNGEVTDYFVKCLGVINIDSIMTGAHALYYDSRSKMWMPGSLFTPTDIENIQEIAGNVVDNPQLLQI